MNTIIHAHTKHVVAQVDPRIFGGFLEHLGRAVYQGVYDPECLHADEHGCRRDVLDALRRLRFTAMRYPGGNFVSGYHWLDGVGPRHARPTVRELAWQSIETNHFGTDEFLPLCRRMNWTPMMAVNLGTGSPEEARNWLEYCNVESGGRWADLRVANGHARPHDVKLWCLGNEMDGEWQIGHVPAEQYAVLAKQAALLMRMVDPSIELVACGTCTVGLSSYLQWDRTVLEHCRDSIDYISVHRYVGNDDGDTADFLACTNAVDQQIEATAALCSAVHHQRRTRKLVRLSFDEWNVWYRANKGEHVDGRGKFAPHLLEEVYNLEDALVAAGFLNSFIRHADSVKIANLAQIVNVIAPVLTRGNDVVLQTIFHPFEMMSKRRDGAALRLVVDGPTYPTKRYGAARVIDASAILHPSGNASLFAVNRSVDATIPLVLSIADAQPSRLLSAEILTGKDPKATNSFEKPHNIIPAPFADVAFSGAGAALQLPPLSLVAATFELS